MCFKPKHSSGERRIDTEFLPPSSFVTVSMNLPVMQAAEWYRELITHLSSECAALRKSEVVRIARTATANQTRMSCDEFHMLSIADSSRLGVGKTARFDLFDSGGFSRLRSFP